MYIGRSGSTPASASVSVSVSASASASASAFLRVLSHVQEYNAAVHDRNRHRSCVYSFIVIPRPCCSKGCPEPINLETGMPPMKCAARLPYKHSALQRMIRETIKLATPASQQHSIRVANQYLWLSPARSSDRL